MDINQTYFGKTKDFESYSFAIVKNSSKGGRVIEISRTRSVYPLAGRNRPLGFSASRYNPGLCSVRCLRGAGVKKLVAWFLPS